MDVSNPQFRDGPHLAEWHRHLTDGFALNSTSLLVFYKEDTDLIRLDLSGVKSIVGAVAVDTKKPYAEIDLGTLNSGLQTWKAAHQSDWAVAIETK